jgi:YVTN family beta-propeller protein
MVGDIPSSKSIWISFGIALLLGGGTAWGRAPSAKLYVANEDDGTISVIDLERNAVVATVETARKNGAKTTMFMAHNVQVAPDGKSVWITAPPMEGMTGHVSSEDEVIVLDPATNGIQRRITLGKDQHLAHVVLDDKSRYAYVTSYEGNVVFKIDTSTYRVVDTFRLGKGKGPHGERLCVGQLYVAEMDGNGLAIIDTGRGRLEEIPLGGKAMQTACAQDGRYVFISLYDTREVVRYDIKTKALKRIAMPKGAQGPVQLYPSPDGKTLYVVDQGLLLDRPASDMLVEINIESGSVASIITVGKGPHGIVVGRDGKHAYVTNGVDNTVSVVDLASHKVAVTIKVGKKPNGVSQWTPDGGTP